jgi:cytochrome c oxidase subunit 3
MIAADAAHFAGIADLQRRDDQIRLGLWMFLATVTMLFAAFISAYIVRRSGSDWRTIALPPILWINTAVLIASSCALELAHVAGSRWRWTTAAVAFGSAFALGLAFLAGQVLAWRQMVASGVYLPTSPHSSFFYMITAAHAVHVVAALSVLASGLVLLRPGPHDARAWRLRMDLCRTFWHYLGGLWLVLFALISRY